MCNSEMWCSWCRSGRQAVLNILCLLYSRKLSREKTFTIYSHPWKVSPLNFRHTKPVYAISLTFCESFFFHEMVPSYWFTKVSSFESFLLYSNNMVGQLSAKAIKMYGKGKNNIIQIMTERDETSMEEIWSCRITQLLQLVNLYWSSYTWLFGLHFRYHNCTPNFLMCNFLSYPS